MVRRESVLTNEEALDLVASTIDEIEAMTHMNIHIASIDDETALDFTKKFIERGFSVQLYVGLATALRVFSNRAPMTILSMNILADHGIGASSEWPAIAEKIQSILATKCSELNYPLEYREYLIKSCNILG
jgi:hypothetical protein